MGYVEIFSALLTPVIALFLVWIAWKEYHTNKKTFRLALYDKRHKVFKSLMSLFSIVVREGKIDIIHLNTYNIETNESDFLFGKEIQEYIDKVRKKAIHLQYLDTMLHKSGLPVGKRRSELAKENSELLRWFGDQYKPARKMFEKYLLFKK